MQLIWQWQMLISTEFIIYSRLLMTTYKVACLLLDRHVGELFVEIGEILVDQVLEFLAIDHIDLTAHLNHLVASLLKILIFLVIIERGIAFPVLSHASLGRPSHTPMGSCPLSYGVSLKSS